MDFRMTSFRDGNARPAHVESSGDALQITYRVKHGKEEIDVRIFATKYKVEVVTHPVRNDDESTWKYTEVNLKEGLA